MNLNHSESCKVFFEACITGNMNYLRLLIETKKFYVNKEMMCHKKGFLYYFDKLDNPPKTAKVRVEVVIELPLVIALAKPHLPVVELLLRSGADPNVRGGMPLHEAVNLGDLKLVRCLLDRGADPNFPNAGILANAVSLRNFELVELLLDRGAKVTVVAVSAAFFETPNYLQLLLSRAGCFLDVPAGQTIKQNTDDAKLASYARLCLAILHGNETRVKYLLNVGAYASYFDIFDDLGRPTALAFKYNRTNILKNVFIPAGVDLNDIYLRSVRLTDDLELLRLCGSSPDFQPTTCRTSMGETALHEACRSGRSLEIIKFLVHEHKLKFNVQDSTGETPIWKVSNPKLFGELLEAFPEINANVIANSGEVLLQKWSIHSCKIYTLLLEHRADPRLGGGRANQHSNYMDKINDQPLCYVNEHLHKLQFVDSNYVNNIYYAVCERYTRIFKRPPEYELEYARMENYHIAWDLASASAKSLCDFIYLSANNAARYSKNKILLDIYEESQQDFKKFFPIFGFTLNYQLRRGMIRQAYFESARDMLGSAFGAVLPHDLTELIFGYFSNSTLERFAE